MKTTSWICCLLAVCICLSEAKNKIRRPLSSPYAPMIVLKKSRPINQRISMENAIHIGGSLSHQRVPYKHANYRIRRPIYNVLSTNWKNQIPMRAVSLNNHPILPQRASTKDFFSINKVLEYSPEYRSELVVLPSTHRGGVDDDKGPIHTIPAPNLNPADKSYNTNLATTNLDDIADFNYYNSITPTQTMGNLSSQETATSVIPPQHQYQVTESNDVTLKDYETAQPDIFQPQDLDISRLYSIIINNPQPQSNELFANHPAIQDNSDTSIIGSTVSIEPFGQSNIPMQTNLHSSLHVGFPATGIPQTPYTIAQQIPADLHVDQPAPGSPLSASQLYSLLNNFPHKLAERYTTDQQYISQHQLGQALDQAVTSFSQPQMHSFNYDEQNNQLQRRQQQLLPDQDYASESITANYNHNSESSVHVRKQNDNSHPNEEFTYPISDTKQSKNNIQYREINQQRNPTTYFDKVVNDNAISTRFYTILPNRETAEKLAALAAAGNVNSRLIGQLRKQEKETVQKEKSMPLNHKNDENDVLNHRSKSQIDDYEHQKYNQPKLNQNSQQQQHNHRQNYIMQNEKLPLQITVPDESDYTMNVNDDNQNDVRKDDIDNEYEYESEDGQIKDMQSVTLDDNGPHIEFDSRLPS
ncbi:uncharacterized protein LOC105836469 isoform X2 [Monomorium pharaonis]|uniref:uncharacterized protein LOC105836469 isoform X2 n=1 Tax=Monomorium pharaonis TaxID=307658 RepID=UPI00063F970C|nr:uncharacterized protein LOC105836469 isoform X2 [Monomorium pharaonis]